MTVYRIISPSGKSYIGITNDTLKRRWGNHIRYANKNHKSHPFRNAIRKYGKDAFVIEVLSSNLSIEDAKFLEIAFISLFDTQNRKHGYNISPGGDYDTIYAHPAAWAAINATPETRAAYINKLSEIKKANDWTDYAALSAASLKWRDGHPDEFKEIHRKRMIDYRKWRMEHKEQADEQARLGLIKAREVIEKDHDSFIAALTAGIRKSFENPARIEQLRAQTQHMWDTMSTEDRIKHRNSISKSKKLEYKNMTIEQKTEHDIQLAEARKSIDHTYRKARQKEAITAYWTPERRAAKAIFCKEFHAKRRAAAAS